MSGHRQDRKGPQGPASSGEREDLVQRATSWTRFSSIGLQFTLAALLFGWFGHWLDRRYGWAPWGLVAGLTFGFGGGTAWMYYKIFPGGNDTENRT